MEHLSRRAHEKLVHEKKILTAAERIFSMKGYEDASMDEIAREAQFTKRTVYQYFENKDELYSAVVLSCSKELFSSSFKATKKENSGYDKLERFCSSYDLFSRENPETIRIINSWGHVRSKAPGDGIYKNQLTKFNDAVYQDVIVMIEEGKADGSIQPGIDSSKTALCILLLVTGFFDRLDTVGKHFTDSYQLDRHGIIISMTDLVIKPLKRSKTIAATRKGTA